MPAGEHDRASTGAGCAAPARSSSTRVERELGELPVVAEDLGVITEPVVRLRRELGLPGMVVLQFALGDDPTNPHLPQNHQEQSVVYTGHARQRHDARLVGVARRDEQRAWTGLDPADPAWSLVEVAWSSRAALAVAPLQDVLALGTRGADEPARHRGGQLAVALRRRRR